jgi:ammonia channel protein AmtB
MVPGLALFYGGMVRAKSVLNMLMMSFSCLAAVTILWVLYGYSLAFAPDAALGLIGDLRHVGLQDIEPSTLQHSVPATVYVAFQLMFAAITAALLSGAIADRAKFASWICFVVAWTTLVYIPIAHWVFAPDGWITAHLRVLDLAGGSVNPLGAMLVGVAAGLACSYAVGLKYRLGYDDSLDVAGVHGVGGVIGMLLIGVLATAAVTGHDRGLAFGGGTGLLVRQAIAVLVVAVYAFGATWLIAVAIQRTIGFRADPEQERAGLDLAVHGESAYELSAAHGGHLTGNAGAAPPTTVRSAADRAAE